MKEASVAFFYVSRYRSTHSLGRSSSMTRLSHRIFVALFLIVTSMPASFAQTSWQQVTDSEAGFSISFPGQPTYQTSTDPVTRIQTEVYKFFYTGRLLRITFAP